MIRLVVGLMHFQQPQALVDRRRQSGALRQQVHRADAARTQTPNPIAPLVVEIAAPEHRSPLRPPVAAVHPPPDSPLATRLAFLYC